MDGFGPMSDANGWDGQKIGVDVEIDILTNCLIDRETGEMAATEYHRRTSPMRRSDIEGWKFDWLHVSLGHDIYELFLKNDPIVQGRVAVCMDKGFARVDIVETAPHNFGHTGRYEV